MNFEHIRQHRPDSIESIEFLTNKLQYESRDLLFLAETLVEHGHRKALLYIDKIRQKTTHTDILDHCAVLENAFNSLRKFYRLEDCPKIIQQRFYKKNGYLLVKSSKKTDKLLVIFTTMFNNYSISNVALASYLKNIRAHLLILKDATYFNYQKGVEEFSNDIPSTVSSLKKTARDLNVSQIYVSGFSSGGYPALLVSLLLSAHGYLGFSHRIDLSENSLLPQNLFMPKEIRNSLDKSWFVDLKTMLEIADKSKNRTLIYGELEPQDVAHALHIKNLDAIKVIGLPGAKHNTILPLLKSEQLQALFTELVADQ